MTRELTESELEHVEENLADLFVHECDNIAAELGLRRVHGAYSDEDAAKINAEFDSQYRQKFIDLLSQNEPDGP